MITLQMGQLYGMNNEKELMQTIKELKNTEMSDDDIETTVKKSMDILGNFNPEKEEGEV